MDERKKPAAAILSAFALSAFVTVSLVILASSPIPLVPLALVFAVLFVFFFFAMQFLFMAHSLAGRSFFRKKGDKEIKKREYPLGQSKKRNNFHILF